MEAVALSSLLVPTLVSAVVVFLASFVAWMVLPHHKSDFAKLPDEAGARAALKGVPVGQYTIPHAASAEDWKSPEWGKMAEEGPVGIVTIKPSGAPNMSKSLAQWFVYCILICFFTGYVASRALAPGADYLTVFQIVGTVAFLGFSAARAHGSIWMGDTWSRTVKDLVDGLVYGLLVAGVFGWLWP